MIVPEPPGKTWSIEPHTRAKLNILRFYLQAWFPILSAGGFPRIVFVDGFAGPGRYLGGEEGSPLVALRAVVDQRLSLDSVFEFHFVERDAEVAARLKHELAAFAPGLAQKRDISVTVHSERTFTDAYPSIKLRLGTAPAFALIDPFGWTGVPFGIVRDLMSRPATEVVFNFMHEEINRFLAQEDQSNNFDVLFGCATWRDIRRFKGYERTYRLHNLYRAQLINDARARFVRSFTMVNDRRRIDYFLFFATNSLHGLERMKEAMWKVDPSGGFQFSDATDPSAPSLFGNQPDLALFRRQLQARYGHTTVPIEQVFEYVVAETAFLGKHARSVLKTEEQSHPPGIGVHCQTQRRSGTFPVDRGIQIEFK